MTLLDDRMTVNRYRQELFTLEADEGKAWAELEMLTGRELIDANGVAATRVAGRWTMTTGAMHPGAGMALAERACAARSTASCCSSASAACTSRRAARRQPRRPPPGTITARRHRARQAQAVMLVAPIRRAGSASRTRWRWSGPLDDGGADRRAGHLRRDAGAHHLAQDRRLGGAAARERHRPAGVGRPAAAHDLLADARAGAGGAAAGEAAPARRRGGQRRGAAERRRPARVGAPAARVLGHSRERDRRDRAQRRRCAARSRCARPRAATCWRRTCSPGSGSWRATRSIGRRPERRVGGGRGVRAGPRQRARRPGGARRLPGAAGRASASGASPTSIRRSTPRRARRACASCCRTATCGSSRGCTPRCASSARRARRCSRVPRCAVLSTGERNIVFVRDARRHARAARGDARRRERRRASRSCAGSPPARRSSRRRRSWSTPNRTSAPRSAAWATCRGWSVSDARRRRCPASRAEHPEERRPC